MLVILITIMCLTIDIGVRSLNGGVKNVNSLKKRTYFNNDIKHGGSCKFSKSCPP
jgi:hypothetical protein